MKFYDRERFKLIGHGDPRTENRIVLWLLVGILVCAFLYIIGFYF